MIPFFKSLKFYFTFLFIFLTGSVYLQTVQNFTANGSFTVPCGVTSIQVECWGAGGGGGGDGDGGMSNRGSGGAGGGYCINTIVVVPGTVINYTVGLGGTAGAAAGGNGGAGGNTTFSTVIANGGGGGNGHAAPNTAVGGGGSGGTVTAGLPGQTGAQGVGNGSGGDCLGPGGGAGGSGAANGSPGNPGGIPGGGASGGRRGAGSGNVPGGLGGRGRIRITYTGANAGIDQLTANCTTLTTSLAATPAGPGLTGTWSVISGTGTVTSVNSPTSGVTGMVAGGTLTLQWTVTGAGCPSTSDQVIIQVPTCGATNDDPCSATVVTVGASCSYTNFTNSGSTNTTVPGDPGCAFYSGEDVWFRITVPASGNVTIDTDDGIITDAGMAVYSGPNCSTLTMIECDDDDSPNGAMSMIALTGRTPGTSIWIRVWEYSGGTTGSFGLCAYEPAVVPTEDCGGAIPVCNDATFAGGAQGVGTQELNGTNQGCLSSQENESTWFGFSPNATGTIAFLIGTGVDYDFAVWGPYNSATCPVTGTPLRCSYSGASVPTGLVAGAGDNTEDALGDAIVNPIVVTAAEVGDIYYLLVDNYTQDASPFTIDWSLSPGGMLDCTPPLPIEIVGFTGAANDRQNEISWTSLTEVNNDYYIVEKSSDAVNYTAINTTNGAGNSNTPLNYHYTDNEPLYRTYYRLKQVDYDGAFEYFGPIVIDNANMDGLYLKSIYPNPVENEFFVELFTSTQKSAQISVLDARGSVMYTTNVSVEGISTNKIETSSWAAGVYLVKIENPETGFQEIQRVVIQ